MGHDRKNIDHDAALKGFLRAADDTSAAAELACLVSEMIEPVAERTLRGKLHVSLRKSDLSRVNQDALEMASEIKLRVLAELHKLRAKNNGGVISDLQAYTATIALNAYRQYLRTRYPLRDSLKNKLRYLLRRHPDFALWEDGDGKWICGVAEKSKLAWESRSFLTDPILDELTETASADSIDAESRTIDLVRLIFDKAAGPIFFRELVSIVAVIQHVADAVDDLPLELIDSNTNNGSGPRSPLEKLEGRDALVRIWNELLNMPVRHRAAILLNLRDQGGDCVVTLLPVLGIASVRQIAAALEFPPDEFARVWNELPWDDNRIAVHLAITRQQVINLRQSARYRLARVTNK